MDSFYFKRHKVALLRLGSVLLTLIAGVTVFCGYSAWKNAQERSQERAMQETISALQDKEVVQKKNYEELELALRNPKLFSDRTTRYLAIGRDLTKTAGNNGRVMVERLMSDAELTMTSYAPVHNQRLALTWTASNIKQTLLGTRVSIKFVGSYTNFAKFLAHVENTVPLLQIQRLNLAPADSSDRKEDVRGEMVYFIIDSMERI